IKEMYVVGVATDYCVKYTVEDGLNLGYRVYVVIDACKGVNLQEEDSNEALKYLEKIGAKLIKSEEIIL
ncbi:MAG: isochorismatase family protein, partial [Fusobacteriaceae bacterium]